MTRPVSLPLRPRPWRSISIVVMAIALLSSLGGCAFEPYPPLPIPPQPQPEAYGSYSALPTPPEAQGPSPAFAAETEPQAADPSAVQPSAEAAPQSGPQTAARPAGQGEGQVPVQEPAWRGDPAAFVGPPKPGPRKLTVRLKSQRFEYSEGGAVVHAGAITSGSPEHPTPRGAYSVLAKDLNKESGSYTNYFDMATPMPYALQFNGPYYVHEGWVAKRPESHGCVRLRYEDARFVYERMQVGDRIAVVD